MRGRHDLRRRDPYGQRNIPVILDFCHDIREVAEPGARFLNYANPMAMNTWAAIEYGKVERSAFATASSTAGADRAMFSAPATGELDYVCSGINHQTGLSISALRGRTIGTDELVAAFEAIPSIRSRKKCGSMS